MRDNDLAKRAVACKHWLWIDGAKGICPHGISFRWKGGHFSHEHGGPHDVCQWPNNFVPDLTDPATLGCLLQLVRDTYNLPCWLAPNRSLASWYVDAQSGSLSVGKTEAEALVAALEAAP